MRDLLQCRDDIDSIDRQILDLLEKRMDVAKDIAEYKLSHNQGITDTSREHIKLQKLREQAKEHGLPASYISDLYKLIMKNTCSVEQQHIIAKANSSSIVRDTSIAHLGSTGSYSHVAAMRFLDGFKGKITASGCDTFEQIVGQVETGKVEFGVLPIENSSSGSINDVLDVIQNTTASIVGELFVPIDHAILGNTTAKLEDITDVYSHPQPVAQCSNWLKDILPKATIHYTKATSEAMNIIRDMNSPHHVAIGSHMAASYYNLVPIVDNIANNTNNYTRFIVISMTPIVVPSTIPAKTSLSFGVQKYTPGSLISVLNEISKHQMNVTKIISRPRLDKNKETWEEIFFADIEGNLSSPEMQDILEDVKPFTSSLKVLGCYPNSEEQNKQH
ncbi:prephenate dehydratase domain-containing protein [uncultured Succinivibrio sp.]|uniref:prephenate dehydratase domain-containing protein n=1 Tax=uncultured Succinivibrio sp. TaxID=540749 RepID=UPI0025D01B58|nr:prephenate dehydratase domain-containing protein [uncultured Succinivibrio sp.]